MIEKSQIKYDIVKWFETHRSVFTLHDDEELNRYSNIEESDFIDMLSSLESKYNKTGDTKHVSYYPHESLKNLVERIHRYINTLEFPETRKQIFGIYYASMEYARKRHDPLLEVVFAATTEEAYELALQTVSNKEAEIHAVPLAYYEKGLLESSEGSDLRSVYTALIKQIKDRWLKKYS